MNRATTFLGLACVVVIVMGTIVPQAQGKEVTGTWTMSAADTTFRLVLRQDGTRITGTLDSPHGPIQLEGQFSKGRIEFAGSGGDPRIELSAEGELQADGTLAGQITSNVGDYAWNAVRQPRQD